MSTTKAGGQQRRRAKAQPIKKEPKCFDPRAESLIPQPDQPELNTLTREIYYDEVQFISMMPFFQCIPRTKAWYAARVLRSRQHTERLREREAKLKQYALQRGAA